MSLKDLITGWLGDDRHSERHSERASRRSSRISGRTSVGSATSELSIGLKRFKDAASKIIATNEIGGDATKQHNRLAQQLSRWKKSQLKEGKKSFWDLGWNAEAPLPRGLGLPPPKQKQLDPRPSNIGSQRLTFTTADPCERDLELLDSRFSSGEALAERTTMSRDRWTEHDNDPNLFFARERAAALTQAQKGSSSFTSSKAGQPSFAEQWRYSRYTLSHSNDVARVEDARDERRRRFSDALERANTANRTHAVHDSLGRTLGSSSTSRSGKSALPAQSRRKQSKMLAKELGGGQLSNGERHTAQEVLQSMHAMPRTTRRLSSFSPAEEEQLLQELYISGKDVEQVMRFRRPISGDGDGGGGGGADPGRKRISDVSCMSDDEVDPLDSFKKY